MPLFYTPFPDSAVERTIQFRNVRLEPLPPMLSDILIILGLILTNGVLAMTELAVVSARKGRLVAKADAGSSGARRALELKNDPSKFLSTVQIGITLIGIFSGTYSGVTLSEPLADWVLSHFPNAGRHADDIAIAIVVSSVTYVSLVIGELVPKQIALRHADSVAMLIAQPIWLLSLITRPLVWLLDVSNRAVLRLINVRPGDAPTASTDDVKDIIAESSEAGVIDPEERKMMERVMRLDTLPISATMTHRRDIVWFDINDTPDIISAKIEASHHSRYPVCDGTIEQIVGLVSLKEVALQLVSNKLFDLQALVHRPYYLPDSIHVLNALSEFKQSTSGIALIVNEHGGLQGIVTLKDILETLIGTLPEPALRGDEGVVEREDGSWLVDGALSLHEAEEMMGISGLSGSGDYHTIAGFVLEHLREIPRSGDRFTWQGLGVEVVDMDGMRIDKVLIQTLPPAV